MNDNDIRINKYLSEKGICSRREADALVSAGHVMINGRTALMGEKVTGEESICVHGKPVTAKKESLVYLILNKPKGIVCTTKNDKDNVIDYLKFKERIFPVGRLDKNSEGLLLLTNDGDIVNKMMRSGNRHEKEYVVSVNAPIGDDFIERMQSGVYLKELNVTTRPCKVQKNGKNTFKIILTQGLNRQIRRMCQMLGYKVISLKRIRIMNIKLGNLQTGQWRLLEDAEVLELKLLIANSSNATVISQKTTPYVKELPKEQNKWNSRLKR